MDRFNHTLIFDLPIALECIVPVRKEPSPERGFVDSLVSYGPDTRTGGPENNPTRKTQLHGFISTGYFN